MIRPLLAADVISPLIPVVNNDNTMWNAGNLADRRPQVRAEYAAAMTDARLILQAEIGVTGAVDAQNLDGGSGTGSLDGVDSGVPTIQVRAAWNGSHFWIDKATFEAGVWLHTAKESLAKDAAPLNGKDSWTSQAYGLDLRLPVTESVELTGEWWSGKNLDDVRGGIGQGVNATPGDPNYGKEIEASGGWGQIGWKALETYTLFAGYSVDNPGRNLPASVARDRNKVLYLANRLRFGKVTFGADYLNWTTDWTPGLKEGTDNRINLFAQFDF